MLLTEDTYRAITGDTDTSTATFASAASAAQELLEEELGRQGMLESAERTEALWILPDGTLEPSAYPVTTGPTGLTVHDDVIYGATPDIASFVGLVGAEQPKTATVTYTGGYTTDSCPQCFLRDLAWVTWTIVRPTTVQGAVGTAGASSVRVGDVAVSWPTEAARTAGEVGVSWSRLTRRYRRRTP